MKIRIVGGPGSGKTTLAKELSSKLNIPHFDTDELKWKSKHDYSLSRSKEKKERLLKNFLNKKSFWIVEGATGSSWNWLSFIQADIVIILKAPLRKEYGRVLYRSFNRLLKIEHGRKETLRGVLGLYRWAKKFRTLNLPSLLKQLDSENISYVVCKNQSQALDAVNAHK